MFENKKYVLTLLNRNMRFLASARAIHIGLLYNVALITLTTESEQYGYTVYP